MLDQPQPRKRHRRPPASEITPETPIWCPACEEYHPAAAFNKESRRFSGLSGICREAQAHKRKEPGQQAKARARNQRRWADPAYRARSQAWQRVRRQRIGATKDLQRARSRLRRIVDDWKRSGCIDCGYDDIRAIDPDHVNPAEKHDNVSRMVQMCASAARIRAELAKCVPRCARCHRLKTAADNPCAWRSAEKLPPSWRRRLVRQDVNDLVKVMSGCTDCGWNQWARGLDWDHVRGVKVAGVAGLIANGRPWIEVMVEMDKCEVVCANCHRLRTLRRKQYTAGLSSAVGARREGARS